MGTQVCRDGFSIIPPAEGGHAALVRCWDPRQALTGVDTNKQQNPTLEHRAMDFSLCDIRSYTGGARPTVSTRPFQILVCIEENGIKQQELGLL